MAENNVRVGFELLQKPWAITPEMYAQIISIFFRHESGDNSAIKAMKAIKKGGMAGSTQGYQIQDGVAIVPVNGVIAKRMSLFAEISGGTSTQKLQGDIITAVNDPLAHSILMIVDSPGGQVDGTQELADTIRSLRDQKPIWSLADGAMNSAAYWIGSAASKVLVSSDTTQIGSIGVIMSHTDYSAALANRGIKITDIFAGKYKNVGTETAPLSDSDKQILQAAVDHMYSVFVDAVAANRGVSASRVLADMADGKIFFGREAIAAGLADMTATASQAVKMLQAQYGGSQASGSLTTKGVTQMSDTLQLTHAGRAITSQNELDTLIASLTKDAGEAGAELERSRIKAVHEKGKITPGHEALIETMMFDGLTSGDQAATKLLEAEAAERGKKLHEIRTDSPTPLPTGAVPTAQPTLTISGAKEVAVAAAELVETEKKAGRNITTADAVERIIAQRN